MIRTKNHPKSVLVLGIRCPIIVIQFDKQVNVQPTKWSITSAFAPRIPEVALHSHPGFNQTSCKPSNKAYSPTAPPCCFAEMPAKTPTKLQVLRPPPAVVAETIEIEVEHCGAEKTATLKKKTWANRFCPWCNITSRIRFGVDMKVIKTSDFKCPSVVNSCHPGDSSNLNFYNDNLRIFYVSRWRNSDTRITQKANM